MVYTNEELISKWMDGETLTAQEIDRISRDSSLSATWARYHIVRDIIQQPTQETIYSIDVSHAVFEAISKEETVSVATSKSSSKLVEAAHRFMQKAKQKSSHLVHLGVAAGVTLMVLTGVRFLSYNENEGQPLMFNTTPTNVHTMPVGGVSSTTHDSERLDQSKYNKIRLLTQEYELQKRLNTY